MPSSYLNEIDGSHSELRSRQKYSAIMLIVSSSDVGVYSLMKDVSSIYHELFADKIKYFYIELREDILDDVIEVGNHIYVRGIESQIPGVITKTMKAIEYISISYDFDYVVRTNLSSFWNLNNLLPLLELLPKSGYYGGVVPFDTFVSGTGIIISKDVAISLSQFVLPGLSNNSQYSEVYEDVLIESIVKSILNLSTQSLTPDHWMLMINDGIIIPQGVCDVLYFRIKNPNRNYDVFLFKSLLNIIYFSGRDSLCYRRYI